jgi:hypothetical protein
MKKINSKYYTRYLPFFAIGLIAVASSLSYAVESIPDEVFSELSPGSYTQQVKDLSGISSCSKYSWKNRGRAPAGYIKGVALNFARSLCRLKMIAPPSPLASILSAADTHNANKDALTHYQDIFATKHMNTNTSGEDPLLALYTLGLGLGMRESSGKYCEGWDVAAGANRSSRAAEAGLFQASYDSMDASPELKKLYAEYKASPERCMLDIFKEGVSCRPQSILGSGAGADYQTFNKACPAFATEYAMTLLRILRKHFGPINKKAAEVNPACNLLLKDVQKLVDSDPQNVCRELF